MSRAIELLEESPEAMDQMRFKALVVNMLERLYARSGTIEMHFPYCPYKCALSALSNGTLVKLDGPFGSLTLHNIRAWPAVFIAGGIGITPFMSILRQATKDQLPQRMILLYSNHRPEDAAFLVELQQLARENSNLQLIATMTKMEKSRTPWDGRTGPIDEHLVIKVCGKLPTDICYLLGPPGMVASMRETLSVAGVNDDDIRSEEFYGY
ncbi:MAG: FAD-dependent oxidoreductase [Rhodoferax sp.]|nr:FAD-dependent oxidoreductase [Rhodoferax sp.]